MNLSKTMHQGQAFIRLAIKDTGLGVEQEHINKIFNRFYQIDDSRGRSKRLTVKHLPKCNTQSGISEDKAEPIISPCYLASFA